MDDIVEETLMDDLSTGKREANYEVVGRTLLTSSKLKEIKRTSFHKKWTSSAFTV